LFKPEIVPFLFLWDRGTDKGGTADLYQKPWAVACTLLSSVEGVVNCPTKDPATMKEEDSRNLFSL
jgi:hypothetical protein